jgi:hypothetical protein
MRRLSGAAKRLVLEIVGWVLVVAGIAALVLPGPGLLMLFAGLALLSQQYTWAEKRVDPIKKRAMKAAEEGVETPLRITLSTVFAIGLIAAGVLWIWSPPAPGWWPLHEQLWLPGGLPTGITQVASGLIAISLIVYSYRRFRSAPA